MKKSGVVLTSCIAAIAVACESSKKEPASLNITPELITSDFECEVDVSIEKVFSSLADIANHRRILSNIVSRTIVDQSELGAVLKENEVLTVSTVVEPEERLAFALFRLFPPNRIEEEMLTDPFGEADGDGVEIQDRKKGSIVWTLQPAGDGTLVTIHSEFAPRTGRVYTAERVNRIWSTHCGLLESDANQR